MRISEGLKIDDKLIGVKAIPQVVDAIPHLVSKGLQLAGTLGPEGIVIAVNTASHAHAAVPVGTAESSIDTDFVDTASKPFL